ncbi:glycosyltransferase family 61 protein [Chloroflexi bacterium TSY]|nr:glycosyltransferase family 61 protein [Chloroflexi bacterium TSY]
MDLLSLLPLRLRRNTRPLRLYLSRKKLKGLRHSIVNENEVEQLFRSFGFTVIYPERMSFEKQVVLYSKAEIIAGFGGSAMHNSVFMPKDSLVINLGNVKHPTDCNSNQRLCDSFTKVQSAFIRYEGKIIDQDSAVGEFDTQHLRREVECLL